MSAFLHRVLNRRRDQLIDALRSSTPPPADAMRASSTAQKLKDYLDKGDGAADVLREKRTLIGRARRLTDPRGVERVTEWLRAPVETQPPRNQAAVEALLRESHLHTLAAKVLCITMAGDLAVESGDKRCAEQAKTPARKLIDVTVWCERLSESQTRDMRAFFVSPEGGRWLLALNAALDTAATLNVPSGMRESTAKRSVIERLLAPFVGSQRVTPEVVQSASAHLERWDADIAEMFFWTPDEHPGHVWMRLFAETLRAMREELGLVGRHHSRGSSIRSA